MLNITAKRPDRQRGLAAVEAAIVLPLLLLMFIATAEVGRALLHYNTLAKGVRDGGHHLAANAVDDFTSTVDITAELETEVKNLARYGNIHGNGTTLLPDYDDEDLSINIPDADHVALIADYPFQPMLFNTLPTFGYGSNIDLLFTLQTSITMRVMEQ